MRFSSRVLFVLLISCLPFTASAANVVIWQNGTEGAFVMPVASGSPVCDIELTCPEDLVLRRLGPIVAFRERLYDVSRPGLYRFMLSDQVYFRNVIVYADDEFPPITILSALANLQVHGEPSVPMPYDPKLLVSAEPYAVLTCGNGAALADRVFSDLRQVSGYPSLRIRIVTTCSDASVAPNGYDDGHRMLEVSRDGVNWVLVDLDSGYLFRRNRKYLDAAGFVQAVRRNQRPEFAPIARKAAILDPKAQYNGYRYAPEFVVKWADETARWNWYRRVAYRLAEEVCEPATAAVVPASQAREGNGAAEPPPVETARRAQRRRLPGEWVGVPYDPANFTAPEGEWIVEARDIGNLSYTVIGQTMTLAITLDHTTVNGSPPYLEVKLPDGARTVGQQDAIFWSKDGDSDWSSIPVAVWEDRIRFYKRDCLSKWGSTTDRTDVRGTLTFRIE